MIIFIYLYVYNNNNNSRYMVFLGNKDTLVTIPKEKGIDVRQELLKFHQENYSSNLMALSVLGKGTVQHK